MARSTKIICVAALTIGCLTARTPHAEVLHDHDNGPLTGYFGIPDSTEGGRLLDSGENALQLSITSASHSIESDRLPESIYLDGETHRFELRYRVGIGDDIEVGVELPYLQHNAGQLDSLIDSWHDFFGLPEGFRPGREEDVLDFRYSDGTGQVVDIDSSASGFGDARLFAAWQLAESERHSTALRLGIKFPTGDSEGLLGSGGIDVSLGLAGDVSGLFGSQNFSGFYRLHAVYIGEPDILANRYKEWVGYLAAGLGYRVHDRVEFLLQGASRSALYDSNIRSLGSSFTTVTVGGNIRIGDRYELSLGVSEDVDVSSAPDVAFQIGLRYRSGGRK